MKTKEIEEMDYGDQVVLWALDDLTTFKSFHIKDFNALMNIIKEGFMDD